MTTVIKKDEKNSEVPNQTRTYEDETSEQTRLNLKKIQKENSKSVSAFSFSLHDVVSFCLVNAVDSAFLLSFSRRLLTKCSVSELIQRFLCLSSFPTTRLQQSSTTTSDVATQPLTRGGTTNYLVPLCHSIMTICFFHHCKSFKIVLVQNLR